jgi:hypothetical protein
MKPHYMDRTPGPKDDWTKGYKEGDEWHYGGAIWTLIDESKDEAVWVFNHNAIKRKEKEK